MVHLHNHTMYSLLDAISKPDDIIKKLKSLNQDAFAITDHGHCYNHAELYKQFQKNGIRMIIGCEVYICKDTSIHDKSNKYYHLILLCKNETGRQNLYKLVTLSNQRQNFYFKPRIDFNMLSQYHDGLICLSACMVGEVQQFLKNDDYISAEETANKYKQLFGNDYYLEIQSHRDKEQQKLNKCIVDLSNKLNIPYTVTCDSHYVNQEDQKYHNIFVQIGEQRESGETYNDCYIQSEDEIKEILSGCLTTSQINEAISNTDTIANKCMATIPLSAPIIPKMEIPSNYKNDIEYLRELCEKGWNKYGYDKLAGSEKKKYRDRLDYELNAIGELGFASYFLMVLDYSSHAKVKGPGRGSAGGSLVARLLGITQIDPIKYGLYFERFIDVSQLDKLKNGEITRQELKIPDIDLDFGKESREQVRNYLGNKYGEDHVASIGTFQYLVAKAAIKDVGRVLGIPFEVTNKMTSMFNKESIQEVINNGILDKYKNKYPELFDYIQKLAGLPKSFSRHACAIIISDNILNYYCPITLNKDATTKEYVPTLELDEHGAEDLGLVKDDLLGLRTMDVIDNTLKLIGKDSSYVDINKIDLSDDLVYKEFRDGHTVGIFQMESPGMTEALKKIKPTCLGDVSVVNALYRPGAMPYIDTFAARKNHVEQISYLHPDLIPILSETYGVMVYQEQLIQVGRLSGLKNPDQLRKACGKKNIELLNSLEPYVKNGLKQRKWKDEEVNQIWSDMVKFGSYAFNKSHANLYGSISYITMYLKHYYPVQFMCCLLNSYAGNIDKIPKYANELRRLNIPVENFDWKHTVPKCMTNANKIVYGTSLIKGLNEEVSHSLQNVNNLHTFHTFSELLACIEDNAQINARQLETLIKLNYFQEFGHNKKLLDIYNEFTSGKNRYSKKLTDKTKAKRLPLLIEYEKTIADESLPIQEQFAIENDVLGFVQSTYPKADKHCLFVKNVDTKFNSALAELYCLKTGKSQSIKINGKIFEEHPFKTNDIIYGKLFKKKPAYKKTENGYDVIPDQFQWWLYTYDLITESVDKLVKI